MIAQPNPTLIDKAIAAVKADPRRTSVLVVLVVVLAVVWWRVMAGGPGVSSAALVTAPKSGLSSLRSSSGEPNAAAVAALTDWMHAPVPSIGRNLFAIKFDYFRQDSSRIKPTLRAPEGDGFWDQLAKSMTSRADQRRERQFFIESIQLQAAQLRLQTTLMGSQPRAMINGNLVAEGDAVASFRILKIEARRIIVEREGIKLEILMK